MDITLLQNNKIKISLKKGKEAMEIILFQDSTLEIDGFKIDSPGEYEIKEIFVEKISFGGEDISEANNKTISLLNAQEVKICYLSTKINGLKPAQIEQIGPINLLIVDIDKFQNKKELSQIILQLEPQIIIPIYKNIEQLNEFLKVRGININEVEFLNKFSLNSKNLTEEKSKVIVLKS